MALITRKRCTTEEVQAASGASLHGPLRGLSHSSHSTTPWVQFQRSYAECCALSVLHGPLRVFGLRSANVVCVLIDRGRARAVALDRANHDNNHSPNNHNHIQPNNHNNDHNPNNDQPNNHHTPNDHNHNHHHDGHVGGVLLTFESALSPHPLLQHSIGPSCRVVPQVVDNQHGFLLLTTTHSNRERFVAGSRKDSSRWIIALEDVIHGRSQVDRLHRSPLASLPPAHPPSVVLPVTREARSIMELYDVGEMLGEGGNSVVRRGVRKSDLLEVALKFIPMHAYHYTKREVDEEVMILAACRHKNILRLHEVVCTEDHVVMCLELLHGSELFTRIVSREQYSEVDARRVAFEMLEAIDYLHTHGIVHCDLKPENLIFDHPGERATLKLVDFGLSSLLGPNEKLARFCGTPQYTAPELLERKPYDRSVDMWSCGVIIYVLLCGYPPFYAHTNTLLGYKIVRGKFHFHQEHWHAISPQAKDLITRLLQLNPRKRLTSREALLHPWFAGDFVPPLAVTNLTDALVQLRRHRAVLGFRKVVRSIMFANLLLAGDDDP